MLESSGFRKYSTLVVFQLFYRRLCLCLCLCHCLCLCLCLCICISVWIWAADVMSFQKMYGLRGPWGRTAVLQLTYELRPKWKKKNNNNKKSQNAVSRSDPLQGSDNKLPLSGSKMGDGTRLCALLFALIFPPISVLMVRGCGCDLILNIILTLLAYIPGMIHAFWVTLKSDSADSPAWFDPSNPPKVKMINKNYEFWKWSLTIGNVSERRTICLLNIVVPLYFKN